jgi:hypothetical protein
MVKAWFEVPVDITNIYKQIYDIIISVEESYKKDIKKSGLKVTSRGIVNSKVPSREYKLKAGNHLIASWALYQMIGCCGICVSTEAWVSHSFRKKGLGKILNKLRIEIARDCGYSLLLCTDVLSNKPQQKILESNRWDKIYVFNNKRTKNDIGIHIIKL